MFHQCLCTILLKQLWKPQSKYSKNDCVNNYLKRRTTHGVFYGVHRVIIEILYFFNCLFLHSIISKISWWYRLTIFQPSKQAFLRTNKIISSKHSIICWNQHSYRTIVKFNNIIITSTCIVLTHGNTFYRQIKSNKH